ncbi:hypothetical protein BASA50_002903 [Batrachochytrium salamandrivorans]|uniref:ubiquitinyl hydrolase 1 n=1 Tax=Batrachochytrium salamandrivorans TaxID=1357716 RepID=A0ABQ8FJV1_9FUNG|nr:hypothetical protein BASA50_002903 [Batrachochytrium salamandrivorans]KAH9254355.1 hypothetical protein BASA81_007637 [Batrachochytrium salamandrivorans]KAH9267965.1 hypothetical protein BASA84_000430 [Batrachochytrium salamandrivorans]
MDLIPITFHEKQEGQLCAQHALNALLQGSYFTAVDLSQLALQLDEEEAAAMAESNINGVESEDFRRFKQAGSVNYDDSGFFSVQVICRALQVWNLELQPIRSPEAAVAKSNPSGEQAFICNLDEHWFTLRRFGGSPNRWYNLNSLFKEPKYVSETYLGMFISQLEMEGYSIFVVLGDLAVCEADLLALQVPIPPPGSLSTTAHSHLPAKVEDEAKGSPSELKPLSGTGYSLSANSTLSETQIMAKSLAESLMGKILGSSANKSTGGDSELDRAIAASIAEQDDNDEMLKRVLKASLVVPSKTGDTTSDTHPVASNVHPTTDSLSETKSSDPTLSVPVATTVPEMTSQELMRLKRLERFQANKPSS